MQAQFAEFIGISQKTSSLIESLREYPDETKDAILLRVLPKHLGPPFEEASQSKGLSSGVLHIGEGAVLNVGEEVYLYLLKRDLVARKPNAVAIVRDTGLEFEGKIFSPSRNSYLQPILHLVQEKLDRINAKGEIISRNAWLAWYASRKGKLVKLKELKDPEQAKKRGGATVLSLEDLGL